MFSLFKQKSDHYEKLHNKWKARHHSLQDALWVRHRNTLESFLTKPKQLAVASLAGIVMLASPGAHVANASPNTQLEKPFTDVDKSMFFLNDLSHLVPSQVQPLSADEETKIAQLLSDNFGISVTAELQGVRLNRAYGIIGQEQHLARYPGDNMETHLQTEEDNKLYYSYGMAPGLGGWGYFTTNGQLTQEGIEQEKWYIAVQTFLAPGYAENTKKYIDFFRHRKMLVVNPQNGKAVVADIADAGPSEWTGKHLGGSPEVMHYLQRVDGADKGPVLYFFIDDKDANIPLGPVTMKQ